MESIVIGYSEDARAEVNQVLNILVGVYHC